MKQNSNFRFKTKLVISLKQIVDQKTNFSSKT